MKKYLVWSGFNPLYKYNPLDHITKNINGGNTGNMMFAYGVMNVLNSENSTCDPTYYFDRLKDADFINDNYDALIFPLADAFRDSFMNQLSAFTSLMKKIKIPCIVIGAGLRAPFEPDLNEKRIFDDTVKEFVKAILDHSECLGLRGDISCRYLSKLGFHEEKDFIAIGCPSLYTYGNSIIYKSLRFDETIKLAVNFNSLSPEHIQNFIINNLINYENSYLIQQRLVEMLDIYLNYNNKYIVWGAMEKIKERLMQEDKLKYFMNIPEWLCFMRSIDLFVGTRFHGTVAAILAGVPHCILPFDSRMRELTEYHSITHLFPNEIKEGSTIRDYIDVLDWDSFRKNHEKNLVRYIDFLKRNNLSSIFDNCLPSEILFMSSPMEREIMRINSIHSFASESFSERVSRLCWFFFYRICRKVKSIFRRIFS